MTSSPGPMPSAIRAMRRASDPDVTPTASGVRRDGGTVQVKNTIIAGNTGAVECTGTITDQGNNLSDEASCGFTLVAAPSLGPLQNNGGSKRRLTNRAWVDLAESGRHQAEHGVGRQCKRGDWGEKFR